MLCTILTRLFIMATGQYNLIHFMHNSLLQVEHDSDVFYSKKRGKRPSSNRSLHLYHSYRYSRRFFRLSFIHVVSYDFCPSEESEHCKARSIQFLDWLNKRPEKCIAVVTHSSFLRHLFSQVRYMPLYFLLILHLLC